MTFGGSLEIVGHLVAFQHHTQKLPGKGALVRIAVGDITVDIGIYCGLWFIKREIKNTSDCEDPGDGARLFL